MANTWYVDRDGNERGPFTGQQLKAMATKGEVKPTDLIRRDDLKEWRLASSVKGLFGQQATPPPSLPVKPQSPTPKDALMANIPVQVSTETSSSAITKPPVWEQPAIIIALMLFCFPVGLILVWMHSKWDKSKKWTWTGVVGGIVILIGIVSPKEPNETEDIRSKKGTLSEKPLTKTSTQPEQPATNKTPKENKFLIPLLATTAIAVATKDKFGANTGPNEFSQLMRIAARELGADKHDNTRHLLQIEPISTKEFVSPEGIRGLILRYDDSTWVSFMKNRNTGRWQLFMGEFGDYEWNVITGIRKKK